MPALILLSYLSLVTLGLIDNIRGPFYPEVLQSLALDGTRGSWFFATASLLAFVGSLTSHRLLNRHSTLNLLLFASALFGIGFALVSQAQSFVWLVAACALFGWAFGTLNVTQNLLVCEASQSPARRRWLSGLHGMYGISSLAAPLLATGVRELGFTWRSGFLLLAIFPVALSIWGLRLRPPKALALAKPLPLSGKEKGLCALFAFMMSFYLWGELSASTRLVIWVRSERGFSPDAADILLAGFFLALLSGRLFFTFVSLPRWNNWWILIGATLMGAASYFVGLHSSPWFVVLAGLLISPFYPVFMDQVSRSFGEKTAQALSYVIGVGNLSLVVMHVTIGWVGDRYGITAALHCGAAALILVALALLSRVGLRPSS